MATRTELAPPFTVIDGNGKPHTFLASLVYALTGPDLTTGVVNEIPSYWIITTEDGQDVSLSKNIKGDLFCEISGSPLGPLRILDPMVKQVLASV
jgi:hypothetical protein